MTINSWKGERERTIYNKTVTVSLWPFNIHINNAVVQVLDHAQQKYKKKKKNQSVSWSLYMLTNLINEQCFSNYFLQQVLLTLTMYSSNCYKIQLLYAPCMLVLLSLQLMWWWSVGKRCDLTEYPHQPQLAALLIKLHFIHHWLLSYILAPNSLIQIHKLLSTSGL